MTRSDSRFSMTTSPAGHRENEQQSAARDFADPRLFARSSIEIYISTRAPSVRHADFRLPFLSFSRPAARRRSLTWIYRRTVRTKNIPLPPCARGWMDRRARVFMCVCVHAPANKAYRPRRSPLVNWPMHWLLFTAACVCAEQGEYLNTCRHTAAATRLEAITKSGVRSRMCTRFLGELRMPIALKTRFRWVRMVGNFCKGNLVVNLNFATSWISMSEGIFLKEPFPSTFA